MTIPDVDNAGAAKRGRPAARWWAPDEVAEVLDVPVSRIRAALVKEQDAFFPGALHEPGEDWKIPQRDVNAMLGAKTGEPPFLFSVARFAERIGFSVPWVHDLVKRGAIKHRRVFGRIRIPATEYWNLPEQRPACIPRRPSFFPQRKAAQAQ